MKDTVSGFLMIYIAVINTAAFCLYSIDKYKAKNKKWRIPEHTLLILAAAGGSLGALASMCLFRHKVRKWKFAAGIPLMLAVQLLLAWLLYQVGCS